MDLKLYNTLTKTKEVFTPLDPENVRMYVCGPTVYDYAHIGNARPAIVFDVLFRLLRHVYGEKQVTYVRNITDVDDKINARALELAKDRGISVEQARGEVTARTEKQYQEDVAALGCLPPTHQPRATAHIPQMIAMIERLIAAGHAYAAEGHVLYDVTSKPDYGKLARRSLEEMQAGARVDVAPYKKGPMDFVLWKPSTPDLPGWDSPWGRGRPGWHIECSAMSEALLGETFDIHGGGIDLVFPHHENEIAQSEGAHEDAHGHPKPFAKVWMHNGFLQVEGQKMSKSLGNFVTIDDLLGASIGSAMRFAMLQTHYRQPIDWTALRLAESEREIIEWTRGVDASELSVRMKQAELGNRDGWQPNTAVVESLSDDLNTPDAITVLRELVAESRFEGNEGLFSSAHWLGLFEARSVGAYFLMGQGVASSRPSGIIGQPKLINELPAVDQLRKAWINRDFARVADLRAALSTSGHTVQVDADGYVHGVWSLGYDAHIHQLIGQRNAARKAKDFKEADRIRAELDAMGVALKDSKDPATGEIVTTWELKR